jgi:hypothetical protein
MKQLYKIDSPKSKDYMLLQLQALSLEPVMCVEVKPFQKIRTGDQNRLMWASLMGDFAEQAFVEGRLWSQAVWHEMLKTHFLPEQATPGITTADYKKWLEMPDGSLKMVGSTTKLTTKGMSDYLEQCYAYGCDLGVMFTANPRGMM